MAKLVQEARRRESLTKRQEEKSSLKPSYTKVVCRRLNTPLFIQRVSKGGKQWKK